MTIKIWLKNLKENHKFTQHNILNSHAGIGRGRPVNKQSTTVVHTIKFCLCEANVIARAAT